MNKKVQFFTLLAFMIIELIAVVAVQPVWGKLIAAWLIICSVYGMYKIGRGQS